jgi:2-amino-4-hydroxy-6-hydroxymethyldihydropteridine diphosphokinase
MHNRIFISLGSNIDREQNLPKAVQLLGDSCRIIAVSSVYETTPVGLEEQPCFWNAAVLVETTFDALTFRREVLGQVESRLRRVRTTDRNAPRTIDADITLFNDEIFQLDEKHHIPDPDLLKFTHVAVPTAELDPDMPHPETGETLSVLAKRLVEEDKIEGRPALWRKPEIKLPAG